MVSIWFHFTTWMVDYIWCWVYCW